MKKMSAGVVLAVVLALPALAWSASPFVSACKAGKYEGTITSVSPEINGKKATLEITQQGDNVVATCSYEGGKETWTWNDKTLNQKEWENGKVVKDYTALASTAPAGTEQNFTIQCKDKAKNECEAGIDFRNNWKISCGPNSVNYQVFGVKKEEKTNLAAKPMKKHEFSFVTGK